MYEDIHYFSYNMRKSKFLSQTKKQKRKDHKPFEQTQASPALNMFWFFSDRKNLSGSDERLTEELLACLVPTQDIPIMMKPKHPVHIMVFGVVTSNADVMPPFIISHGFRL